MPRQYIQFKAFDFPDVKKSPSQIKLKNRPDFISPPYRAVCLEQQMSRSAGISWTNTVIPDVSDGGESCFTVSK